MTLNGNEDAFPTRYQMVGNMHCLFVSWYKQGAFPLMSVGPSWKFLFILWIFVMIMCLYMYFLIEMVYETYMIGSLIIAFLSIINILVLCNGVFGDPGIPPEVYRRWSKFRDYKDSDSDVEMSYATTASCEAATGDEE